MFVLETKEKNDNSSSDNDEDTLINQPPQKKFWFPLEIKFQSQNLDFTSINSPALNQLSDKKRTTHQTRETQDKLSELRCELKLI